MTESEVWDEMLLPLADQFESGNPRTVVSIKTLFAETFEPVRQCIAMKKAEGSLLDVTGMGDYQLTPQGYAKYKARIDFLRTFASDVVN